MRIGVFGAFARVRRVREKSTWKLMLTEKHTQGDLVGHYVISKLANASTGTWQPRPKARKLKVEIFVDD